MSDKNDELDEFDEIWDLREVDFLPEEFWAMSIEELIPKAEKDPFYNRRLKKGKKEPKSKKTFSGYNCTTIKKMNRGQRDKIKSLKAKAKLSDSEEIELARMVQLYKWSTWALKMHKEGWSDKRIHDERRKAKAKART